MFRKVHSVLALAASVFVIVMAMTGAILSLNPVLDRTASSIPSAGVVSVSDLAAKVATQYTGIEKIVRKPSGMVLVSYSSSDSSGTDIVDPVSGARMDAYLPSDWTRFFTNLHRSFMMDDAGRIVAGCCAAIMLVLSLTGFVLLAKRLGGWRQVFSRIRGSGVQRIHSEIGRVVLAFLVITAFTGTYMSLVTFSVLSDGGETQPAMPASVNGGAQMALADMPALKNVDLSSLRELTFPMPDDANDVFTLRTANGTALIDQATGEQVAYQPNTMSQQIYQWIVMLHTGQDVWWLSLCLGLAALSVPFMAVSGVWIAWKRWASMPHFKHNGRANSADTIILVGSEGNATWGFARTLHDALVAAGHHVHTAPMNALAPAYTQAKQMFILTSTYGDGSAPQSAKQFLGKLDSQKAVLNVKVALLGFGDKQFTQYCQFAKDVEMAMKARGWAFGLQTGFIDRQSAQDFQSWGEAASAFVGSKLTLVHQATLPKTIHVELQDRDNYGEAFQSPASVMRFALPKQSFFKRLISGGMPKFEVGDLIGIVPPGSSVPRYYSLATSSSDGMIEICVRNQPGGLCSEYLHDLQPGDACDVFVMPNPEFRPKPGKTPIILIGAGTGIGPLAGFVRHNQQHRPMHMYFGVRDPSSDFLYEKELRGWLADNRLTNLYVAFSRITQQRAYVQDHVRADRETILRLLSKGGQIIVCGGRDMAMGVKKALDEMLAPLELDVAALKRAGLFVEDVY